MQERQQSLAQRGPKRTRPRKAKRGQGVNDGREGGNHPSSAGKAIAFAQTQQGQQRPRGQCRIADVTGTDHPTHPGTVTTTSRCESTTYDAHG